ncbi:WD40-repeat-containing domain protein [Gymnopilus junonius]|uniref:WD40-repeat-containing domain protein n=1 Tax=Gymnopilus junonius TaxID=109634 RepID=A0A9P5TPH2_GYMJU|nr:WD40-repeat-containing domain protein [Gymnopilus junonius]
MRRYELRNAIVESACNGPGFPYSRRLEAHRSCVNALAFSSGDGRFLASGGDDRRICLWDFNEGDVKTPSFTLKGPQDSIRDLACHPLYDEVLISVSEDGTVRRYDGRQAMGEMLQTCSEVSGVQYHPTLEHFFVTSDDHGSVVLRDVRMAFGSQTRGNNQGIVQRYNTKLSKRSASRLSSPEASSVTFDRDGSRLAVTFLHYSPTIYALSDPDPIAVLNGKNLPDGTPNPPSERTYSNSCTMKHGSFGGPGIDINDMYAGGSDDFRCYVWKVPSAPQLINQRQNISADDWEASGDVNTIAFSESRSGPKVLPVEISTPLCRLTGIFAGISRNLFIYLSILVGHNSIVNTALFHPHYLHVVTAGVEKKIILHSSTQSSPCTQNLQLSPSTVRKLDDQESERDRAIFFTSLDSGGLQPTDITEDIDERQTLSIFDHIIREEGEADVFQLRPWESSDSSDEESDDSNISWH